MFSGSNHICWHYEFNPANRIRITTLKITFITDKFWQNLTGFDSFPLIPWDDSLCQPLFWKTCKPRYFMIHLRHTWSCIIVVEPHGGKWAKWHQQDQLIRRINGSAGTAHQQDQRISRISWISETAGSAHQKDQRISRISTSTGSEHQRIITLAGSAHQQDQLISRISGSAGSADQEDQLISRIRQCISRISS